MDPIILNTSFRLSETDLVRPIQGKECIYYAGGKCVAVDPKCPCKNRKTGECECNKTQQSATA